MENSKVKAIILAAGKGERLRPLTDNLPKCMVKLFGKNLLQWQLDTFRSCGINDITVVTGYKNEKIGFSGIKYYKNPDYESTNMIETLFCAYDQIEGSVIVSYGDIIFEKKNLKKLIESKNDISVVIDSKWKRYWQVRFDDPLDDAESLIINNEGFIQNIGQKVVNYSEIQGQYIGLMKFQNDGIKNLKNFYKDSKKKSQSGVNPLNPSIPFEKSFLTDLLQGLILAGYKIKAIPIHNGWLEVDSIQDYNVYKKLKEEGNLEKFISLDKIGNET